MSLLANHSHTALRLHGEHLIQVETKQNHVVLSNDAHQLELQGSFAQAVQQHIKGLQTPLLKHIEAKHPWLAGLSTSTCIEHTDASVILGASLGMLFIEMTSRCNERCLHCYADSSPERNDFLTLETIKHVLEQSAELGTPFVQLTGGDPLIHPDLVATTAYAHQLGLKNIEIFTNGLLLRPPLLSELAPYAPRFCFSLYSHIASIHDAITCVPGSMEKTIAAIRRVQAENLEVRIGIALMQRNADSLTDTLTFLQDELGIPAHFVRIDPINTTGRGSDVEAAKHVHIQHTTTSHSNENQEQHQRLGKLAISSDGSVHPCVFARHIRLGNIHQQTLQEIFTCLNDKPASHASEAHWQACKKRLSCHDCRIIAYHLGA